MHLDKSTLKKVAALARIKVYPEEIEEYSQGLSNILTWIEQLQEVNTATIGILPRNSIEQAPLRADIVTEGGQREALMKNASEVANEIFFSVPKVIE